MLDGCFLAMSRTPLHQPRKRTDSARAVPLARVGQLHVPSAALNHRFVQEVRWHVQKRDDRTVTDVEDAVVGTDNTCKVELYGWGRNIDPHVDATGWVYLCALDPSISWVYARAPAETPAAPPIRITLEAGTVLRLDDRVEHWTKDPCARICLFMGSFEAPCDDFAISHLEAGLQALARGDYYGAPRVARGFQKLQQDECLATDWQDPEPLRFLRVDAVARGMDIITCSNCGAPAVRLDHHWPWHQENNVCASCDISSPS